MPASVGEIPVDRLALGAAMGRPACSIRSRATAGFGTRTPTVSLPAVTMSGIRAERGRTRVSGPGQNAAASLRCLGPVGDARAGHVDAADVDDQRVDRGPPLGLEDPGDGLGVGGVGAQAVDGLGGEGDEAPLASRPRRPRPGSGRVGIMRIDGDECAWSWPR